jgi:hypothetical protein
MIEKQMTMRALKSLYRDDPIARHFFDWCAQQEYDFSETSIDAISYQMKVSRGDAVSLARALHNTRCGNFIVGRRHTKSTFAWTYSSINAGQVAAGESSDLEKPIDPRPGDAACEIALPLSIVIASARASLAKSLDLPLSSIEIFIKA